MADAWRALYDAGLRPIMSVHDEFVFECGEHDAEHVLATASNIIRTGPAWAAGLPLDVDGQILTRYAK